MPMRGKQINNVFLTKALKIENIVTKKNQCIGWCRRSMIINLSELTHCDLAWTSEGGLTDADVKTCSQGKKMSNHGITFATSFVSSPSSHHHPCVSHGSVNSLYNKSTNKKKTTVALFKISNIHHTTWKQIHIYKSFSKHESVPMIISHAIIIPSCV